MLIGLSTRVLYRNKTGKMHSQGLDKLTLCAVSHWRG